MVTHDHFKDFPPFSQAEQCGANRMAISRITLKLSDEFGQHSKYINVKIMRIIMLLPKTIKQSRDASHASCSEACAASNAFYIK